MDFQVGDKVVCLLKGSGEVVSISDSTVYPIEVLFWNDASDLYTINGYLHDGDEYPCLFHESTEINIKPAQPKRYPWVNIYVSDNGCAEIGKPHPTLRRAKDSVSYVKNGFYVDTIQLKPKEE